MYITYALRLFMLLMGVVAASHGRTNNLQVTAATLANNNTFTGTVDIQFDISWENSWRGGALPNWDAAWVFVKYKVSSNGTWRHAYVHNTGHSVPAAAVFDLGLVTPGAAYNVSTNPVVGLFIRRGADGFGNLALTGVSLRWNYGAYGINFIDIAEVRVLAVEMVYVTQGPFAAGSGGSEPGGFTLTTINTPNASTVPSGTGSLGGQAGGYATGSPAPNAAFPNGFNAFYCMKYEMSQQAYVDFLNTLSFAQQLSRVTSDPTNAPGTGALVVPLANRNGIVIATSGVAFTSPAVYGCDLDGDGMLGEPEDGGDLACPHTNWDDMLAYLDWSGLRPISEYEFEKACRGTTFPLANEFVWGTTTVNTTPYTLSASGAFNEGIATGYAPATGNAAYATTAGTIDGPLRVGVFAAHGSNTGRVTSGASYYGIMELGGNLRERIVIGAVVTYTGLLGDGMLSSSGSANTTNWPTGGGFNRGGYFGGAVDELRTSHKGGSTPDNSRTAPFGVRGVRNTP